MIYNLAKYIEDNYGEMPFVNALDFVLGSDQIPDRVINIQESGGSETGWFQYRTLAIQIYTRDIDSPKAKRIAEGILAILNNKFGLVLEAVTVGGTLYPQIQSAQISVNSLPNFLGVDKNGRAEYTTNYRIIYTQEV